MAMSLDKFKVLFPEFGQTPDPVLQAHLDQAAVEFDVVVWRGLLEGAHGLLTAHKLSCSPYGQAARLNAKDGRTTYLAEYERLRLAACCGSARVTKAPGEAT